ncbi:MAG: 2-keto-4-pentenoate hydratase [Rhizobiales bacterium]|nr:2-keto-4-pentenoate hydratase [Hyphomicrobiales bacterium]
MANYKLVTYDAGHGARAGIVVNDTVHDVAEGTGNAKDASVRAMLTDWDNAKGRLAKLAASAKGGRPLASVKLLPPMPDPIGIFCAGANYTDHVAEMAKAHGTPMEPDPHTLGLKSWHFLKTAGTLAAAGETVHLPRRSKKVDWEVELVAVIGRKATNVPLDKALDYIAGYTIGNDLSARDAGVRPGISVGSPFRNDWVAHKCFDQSCPLGPWIVPAEDLKDPQNLKIQLYVNGELMQDSNTSAMIFNIAEQVSHLSEKLTLHPGDLVLTGTPAGVGTPRNKFLQPGDTVRCHIEGIGDLENKLD